MRQVKISIETSKEEISEIKAKIERQQTHTQLIRDVLLDYCSTTSEARRIEAMDFDQLVECLEYNIETGLLDYSEYSDLLPTTEEV